MIDILMAVYNGEKYLAQQIDSILAQDCRDWRLYIRDDGSSDRSPAIASEYEKRFPERITAEKNAVPSGSACANFMGMLKSSAAEYVMFSDQDDFWLPEKVGLTLEKMKRLERDYGDRPLLVHTEMEVVDEALRPLRPAFTKFQGLDPRCTGLNRLLTQNNVTGCTLMMNRRLAALVEKAPSDQMLMHDWWIALAASAFGEIGFLDKPLSKYRQHGGNQLGAVNHRSVRGALRIAGERLRTKKRVSATYAQAESFYRFYRDRLDGAALAVLERYADLPRHPKPVRAARLIRYGYLKQNFPAAAGQLLFC